MSPISNHLLSSLKTTVQWQPRHEDKSTGREEKGGRLKWESSSSSCSEANFVLSGSFRVRTWTWTESVRTLRLLLPLLTQLLFPAQILEGSLGRLCLHQGQQVITLFSQHQPASLCLLTAAGKREGCARESLLLHWLLAALFKTQIQLAGHPSDQQPLNSWRRPSDRLDRNLVRCIPRCSDGTRGFRKNCLERLECLGFNWDALLYAVILLTV